MKKPQRWKGKFKLAHKRKPFNWRTFGWRWHSSYGVFNSEWMESYVEKSEK